MEKVIGFLIFCGILYAGYYFLYKKDKVASGGSKPGDGGDAH